MFADSKLLWSMNELENCFPTKFMMPKDAKVKPEEVKAFLSWSKGEKALENPNFGSLIKIQTYRFAHYTLCEKSCVQIRAQTDPAINLLQKISFRCRKTRNSKQHELSLIKT